MTNINRSQLIGVTFCLLSVAPTLVFADCSAYFKAKKDYEIQERELLFRYPGTATALLGCMAACSDDPNPGGCALLACGMTCLVVGMENCGNFFNEAIALQQYHKRVEALNNGCSGSSSSPRGSNTTAYSIKFENKCRHKVKLAVHYKDTYGNWETVYWWDFSPGGSAFLADGKGRLTTKSSLLYYYAESTDGSDLFWVGDHDFYKNGLKFNMRKLEDKSGDTELTLTCK